MPSACDDEAKSVDPGPTAAVDAGDAVAAGWDERVSVIESVSGQYLVVNGEDAATYPDPPVAFP